MPTCQQSGCRSKQKAKDRGDGVVLCDTCERNRAKSAVEDIDGNDDAFADADAEGGADGSDSGDTKLVINELLCYVFNYIDSCSPDMVVKAVEGFYSESEIHQAKETLWRECGPWLTHIKSRRRGSTRYAAEAEVKDIVFHGALAIRNAETRCNVDFCAVDIRRLPKFTPEEVNLQSIITRVIAMETQMKAVQEQTACNAARLTAVEELPRSVPPYATGATWPTVNTRSSEASGNDNGQPSQQSLQLQQRSRATPYLTGEERIAHERDNSRHPGPRSSTVPVAHQSHPATVEAGPSQKQSEWQTQRHERRKRIRDAVKNSRVVVGTKNDSSDLSCGVEGRNIFVFNVNKKYSDSDLTEFMKASGAEILKIKQISHVEATSKSFKVLIRASDFDSVMSAEFWQEGIKCREWINWINVSIWRALLIHW